MLADSFIEELKYANDIEQVLSRYVHLTKKGSKLTGLCPFHSEKTPSFTVYPDTQSYYCFGCGNGGDVITFVRQMENLDYIETVRFLAGQAGIHMPEDTPEPHTQLRARILEMNRESARFFHDCLLGETGQKARSYLLGRGLTSKTIRRFGIGFAPDNWDRLKEHLQGKGFQLEEMTAAALVQKGKNGGGYDAFRNRVIFPIIDLRGNVIAFGGRNMGDRGPKYLNSSDTPVFKKSRNLFALNFAKKTQQNTLILGEGYMDVVAMHQAGFTNAVATLGTALTEEQARLISRYAEKVIIAYDSDGAGQAAAKRAIQLFASTTVAVSILQMEGAKDPDEYIQKFGADRFANLLTSNKSAIQFEIDKLKQPYHFTSEEDKIAFLNEFTKLIATVPNVLQQDVYIGQIAAELQIPSDGIRTTVQRLQKQQYRQKQKEQTRALVRSVSAGAGTEQKPYKKNIEGLVAEEMLITMLFSHPDYYNSVAGKLHCSDFSDPGLCEIYTQLEQRIQEDLPLDLIHFSAVLSNQLMAKLSQMLLKGKSIKFYPVQAADYVSAILAQNNKKDATQLAAMTEEEYRAYLEGLRADKQ